MRRAFTRCSASLLRPTSSLSATNTVARNLSLRSTIAKPSPLQASIAASRGLHQVSRLRQEASAQRTDEDGAQVYDAKSEKITRFAELETSNILHPNIVHNLTQRMGMETMTDVQSATINEALSGRDIIAQAKTGTGKTLAFLLPILQNIVKEDPSLAKPTFGRRGPRTTADDIRGLIISPTRELAEQIATEAKRVTAGTGIIVQCAVGGTQKSAGLRAIQRDGCHLLIGTPGRLKDILTDPYSRVEAPDLSALVLDEADRLLDQGFWPHIQEIMHLLPTPAEKNRQTLMFSATVPRDVVDLVRQTLRPGFQFVKTVRDDEEPTHARVPQRVVTVKGFENKIPALAELCQRAIEAGNAPDAAPFKAIVYYNSTAEVALAKSALVGLKAPGGGDSLGGAHLFGQTRIMEIHAKLTQSQRTRAAEDFKRCKTGILISSDVTARGMDFPNVTHVIQMACPSNRDQYIHRIGRTARAGKEGEGWLFVSGAEISDVRDKLRKLPLQDDKSLETAGIDLSQESRVSAEAGSILSAVQDSMRKVSTFEKGKAYLALLGVYGWMPRKQSLVDSMNDLAKYGWGMSETPNVPPMLARKLGLARVAGLNLGMPEEDPRDSFGPRGGRGGGGGGFGSGGGRDFGSRGGRDFGSRGGRDLGSRGGRDFGGDRRDRSDFGGRSDRGGFGGDREDRPRRSFSRSRDGEF